MQPTNELDDHQIAIFKRFRELGVNMTKKPHLDRSTHNNQPSSSHQPRSSGISRRSFLGLTGVGAPLVASAAHAARLDRQLAKLGPGFALKEVPIASLQGLMSAGQISAVQLAEFYLARIRGIDQRLGLNAVLQTNPDALQIARSLDEERAQQGPRGPLHGIPIFLKDNIDTGDNQQTTAGSLALVGAPAPEDATVTARLRASGAVILGKTNLSEWANFRGFNSSSGWSGVGGQCNNPFFLDRNPCGSSSGSGAAVSANLCAAALGTETDGSVVCPAAACGVVGIKPTVGLTSRAGVVPISSTQDTVGVHGRTVADAAAVLGALTGVDPRDPKTSASQGNSFSDYTQFLDSSGLQAARIGVVRQFSGFTDETAVVFEQALQVMRDAGAEVIDVEIPSFNDFSNDSSEIIVLIYEFKRDLNAYLATRTGVPVTNMAEVIQFNLDNFGPELRYFGQEWFDFSQAELFSEDDYLDALERGPMLAGAQGIDATLADFNVDALVAPTNSPAWPSDLITGDCFQFGTSGFAAVAGYPLITVPAGYVFDLPVGMTFMGTAWSEPMLIKLASGFEAASGGREQPAFKPTLIRRGGFLPLKSGGAGQPNRPATRSREQMRRELAGFLKPRIRKPIFL